ncbi:MAG: hypothetical protein ArsCj_1890 [Arsenophonus endosymbiont of Ceratovacuna japonica]
MNTINKLLLIYYNNYKYIIINIKYDILYLNKNKYNFKLYLIINYTIVNIINIINNIKL